MSSSSTPESIFSHGQAACQPTTSRRVLEGRGSLGVGSARLRKCGYEKGFSVRRRLMERRSACRVAVALACPGKRVPGTSSLVQIASSFEVDALRLMNEPFATVLPQLADPERFDRVEKRLNGLELGDRQARVRPAETQRAGPSRAR